MNLGAVLYMGFANIFLINKIKHFCDLGSRLGMIGRKVFRGIVDHKVNYNGFSGAGTANYEHKTHQNHSKYARVITCYSQISQIPSPKNVN